VICRLPWTDVKVTRLRQRFVNPPDLPRRSDARERAWARRPKHRRHLRHSTACVVRHRHWKPYRPLPDALTESKDALNAPAKLTTFDRSRVA